MILKEHGSIQVSFQFGRNKTGTLTLFIQLLHVEFKSIPNVLQNWVQPLCQYFREVLTALQDLMCFLQHLEETAAIWPLKGISLTGEGHLPKMNNVAPHWIRSLETNQSFPQNLAWHNLIVWKWALFLFSYNQSQTNMKKTSWFLIHCLVSDQSRIFNSLVCIVKEIKHLIGINTLSSSYP